MWQTLCAAALREDYCWEAPFCWSVMYLEMNAIRHLASALTWCWPGPRLFHMLYDLGEVSLTHATATPARVWEMAGTYRNDFWMGMILTVAVAYRLVRSFWGLITQWARRCNVALMGMMLYENAYVQVRESCRGREG